MTAAIVVGLFAAASTTSAQAQSVQSTPLATDTFDRTVSSGLSSATTGGAYTGYGDPVLSVSGGAARVNGLQPGHSVGAFLGQTSSLDTVVESALVLPTVGTGGTDVYVALESRKQADGSSYRGKFKISTAGVPTLSFSRTAGSAETLLGKVDLPTVVTTGQTLHLQFQVSGSAPVQLQSRAWLDGTTQPSWQYQLADSAQGRISKPGSVGFWSYASSAGKTVSFSIPQFNAESLATVQDAAPAPAPTPAPTPAPAPAPAPAGKPSAADTGVPAGTTLTRYTGPLTITTDGTVIDGKAVYGDLKIQAGNVTIRNSYLHCGTNVPSGNSGCVDANSAAVKSLLIQHNTIIPDRPSYYRDGIVGHEFTATNNHISRTNDGIGIFNRPGGPVEANVTVKGNYIHDLTHWNNDPAHSDGTHNDGIQIQGGTNININGNTIIGSVVAGDGLGQYGSHGGAGIIVNQNVSKIANVVIDNNWIDDAQNSVCITNGKYPTVALTLSNNLFGRNQYDFGGGSKYPIRIYSKSASQVTGLLTNRWEDTRQLMTEGRDTGIRFNGA